MLLNYVEYTNPISHKFMLEKLRDFAVAQGWTATYYKQNDTYASGVWTGAGTSDHLELTSNGYGSQTMIFRFEAQGVGADPLHEWVYHTMVNQTIPGLAGSTAPVLQNSVTPTYNNRSSVKPGISNKLWIFGDDKRIILFNQIDTTLVMGFWFGSFELFETTRNDCFGLNSSRVNAQYANTWYDYQGTPSESSYHKHSFAPNASNNNFYSGSVVREYECNQAYAQNPGFCPNFAVTTTSTLQGALDTLKDVMACTVPWSQRRLMLKPKIYQYDSSYVSWRPVGQLPIYYVDGDGLSIGQELDEAGETYLCLPQMYYTAKYWMAMRIV